MLVSRVCRSFWKASLKRTSSSFAKCSTCTFESELVVKSWQRFVSLSFVLRCCKNFHQRKKATNIMCVLSHRETLNCENKINRSFDDSSNKIEIFIRVDWMRHRNFPDYFCFIHIFSAKLSTCTFAQVINLARKISKNSGTGWEAAAYSFPQPLRQWFLRGDGCRDTFGVRWAHLTSVMSLKTKDIADNFAASPEWAIPQRPERIVA